MKVFNTLMTTALFVTSVSSFAASNSVVKSLVYLSENNAQWNLSGASNVRGELICDPTLKIQSSEPARNARILSSTTFEDFAVDLREKDQSFKMAQAEGEKRSCKQTTVESKVSIELKYKFDGYIHGSGKLHMSQDQIVTFDNSTKQILVQKAASMEGKISSIDCLYKLAD